ncbi:MAG: hypothetical protein JOZ39_09370, partial [Chloroflexi bacterium]|nr:hypothetical protein [Chloroflexota bacterium]
MNFKFTLALLVIAVLAIGGFTVAQKQLPATPTATTTPTVFGEQLADVTGFDIKTKSGETDIVKDGPKWKLTKP